MTTITHAVGSEDLAARASADQPMLLLLHGFGSHEHDLAGLIPAMGLTAPWASLRAPIPQGAGAAWFPIRKPGNPDAEPVEEATEAIWAWVDSQVGDDVQVVPLGFSQGGLMASQLLRSRPSRVPGAVILGGFVLDAVQPGDDEIASSPRPVFWGRGEEDLVITPEAVARTAAFLPEHSTLDARTYPGLAHGINEAELADVRSFLGGLPGLVSAP